MSLKLFYIAAVFLFFISAEGFAQYTPPDMPVQPPQSNDDKNLTVPLSPEESAYMTADLLKFDLKLSDEQYKQVYNISLEALKKKDKLWDAEKDNVIDKNEMKERLQKIDEGTEAQMKDILSDEQYEKYMSKRKGSGKFMP